MVIATGAPNLAPFLIASITVPLNSLSLFLSLFLKNLSLKMNTKVNPIKVIKP